VANPQNAVAIDLTDEGYSQLVVEADPDAAVSLIRGSTAKVWIT
jgi:hypothetical protein